MHRSSCPSFPSRNVYERVEEMKWRKQKRLGATGMQVKESVESVRRQTKVLFFIFAVHSVLFSVVAVLTLA